MSALHHTNSELWKQIVDPGAGHLALTTIQTYDDAGNVVGVTDPRGGVSIYQWNARRLLTHGESPTTSSGFPYVVEHDYDLSGRRIATRTVSSTGGWETTSSVFDADGRVISAIDPAGDEIQTVYDLLGRTSVVTDPMGRRTLTEYFADGLVQRIKEAYGTPLQRDARTNAYNNNSELLSVTSAKGFTTSYQFDGYGRLAQANYPVTPTSLNPNFESFGYDNNGNQTTRRTRSGAQFTLVYDAMNRLIRETGPDRRETFGYDASSLRTCAEVWPAASGTTTCGSGSPTHRVTAAFDLAMRVSSESARRAGTTRTASYQYDANGNRSRVTWPDGWYAAYVFDAFNQLTAVDDSAAVALWRQSWRRDARLGNVLRTGTAWNSGPSPAEGMTDLSYEADGDVSLMSHRFLAQGAGTQFNFTYGYNLASQLVSEAVNQPNWQWAGTTADTVPYAAANALDQYPSVDGLALTYDTNGNRTGYAGLTTTHDAENRLTAASKTGLGVTYLYDADGRRVWKDFTSGGSDTDFLSAGQMEIAEYDSTGKLLRRYVPGVALNERLVMISCGAGAGTCPSPATFSYTTNRQGSIIALVNSAGAISDRYLYTPYGVEEPLASSTNPFRYTGQRFDPETGLYYYHARYYDPMQGKFLETDPVSNSSDMNTHAYAFGDPINLHDPNGEAAEILRDESARTLEVVLPVMLNSNVSLTQVARAVSSVSQTVTDPGGKAWRVSFSVERGRFSHPTRGRYTNYITRNSALLPTEGRTSSGPGGTFIQIPGQAADKTVAHEVVGHGTELPDVYDTTTDQPNPDMPQNLMNNDDFTNAGVKLEWQQVQTMLDAPENVVREKEDPWYKSILEWLSR